MSIARNQIKQKALDLFPQGEQGVYDRMMVAIKEGLETKVEEIKKELNHNGDVSDEMIINAIAKKLYIDADRLLKVHQNESKKGDYVDYELFDRLEFPLGLKSIHQVLLSSKESLRDESTRDRWLREYRKRPIVPVAAVVQSNMAQYEPTPDDKLELFVMLRAIKELRRGRSKK